MALLCFRTAVCRDAGWVVFALAQRSVVSPGSVSENMSSMKAGAPGGAGSRLLCPWDFLGKNYLPHLE